MTNKTLRTLLQAVCAAVLLVAFYLVGVRSAPKPSTGPAKNQRAAPEAAAPVPGSAPGSSGASAIADAFRSRRSNVEVEAGGRVTRVLPDDRAGSRHERFLVRIGGVSVLVAHNLELAPRVPVTQGDSVELRGEYEWNAKGGVIHWTHRDPDGRHEAGWIRHRGQLYR